MKLAGQDVNANPSTAMPRNCPEDLLSAGAPCQYGYGIIYGTESTDNGSGPCGSPTAPSQLEKSAEYDLDLAFVGNASAGLTNTLLGGQYGYKSLPKTVTVKLH
jgi:hypothetical protein